MIAFAVLFAVSVIFNICLIICLTRCADRAIDSMNSIDLPNDIDRYANLPFVSCCPCCSKTAILLVKTIRPTIEFSHYYSNNYLVKECGSTVYQIECSQCGIQTKERDDLVRVIEEWNGLGPKVIEDQSKENN